MKDFNIKELFCEIFSGIIAIIVSVLILDCFEHFNIKCILNDLEFNFGFIATMIILSYFVGLIIDSIGLSLGELFLDKLATTVPELTDEENQNFYNKASEYVFLYRYKQWKYYSLYKNLFILVLIGLPFYIRVSCNEFGLTFSIVTSVILILVLLTLFYTMRILIDYIYKITRFIEKEKTNSNES